MDTRAVRRLIERCQIGRLVLHERAPDSVQRSVDKADDDDDEEEGVTLPRKGPGYTRSPKRPSFSHHAVRVSPAAHQQFVDDPKRFHSHLKALANPSDSPTARAHKKLAHADLLRLYAPTIRGAEEGYTEKPRPGMTTQALRDLPSDRAGSLIAGRWRPGGGSSYHKPSTATWSRSMSDIAKEFLAGGHHERPDAVQHFGGWLRAAHMGEVSGGRRRESKRKEREQFAGERSAIERSRREPEQEKSRRSMDRKGGVERLHRALKPMIKELGGRQNNQDVLHSYFRHITAGHDNAAALQRAAEEHGRRSAYVSNALNRFREKVRGAPHLKAHLSGLIGEWVDGNANLAEVVAVLNSVTERYQPRTLAALTMCESYGF